MGPPDGPGGQGLPWWSPCGCSWFCIPCLGRRFQGTGSHSNSFSVCLFPFAPIPFRKTPWVRVHLAWRIALRPFPCHHVLTWSTLRGKIPAALSCSKSARDAVGLLPITGLNWMGQREE